MAWAPFMATVDTSSLTTSTTAYSANDVVGTLLTLAAVAGTNNGYGVINGITLVDDGDVMGACDIFAFADSITIGTDNAAVSWSDADAAKIVPGFPVLMPAPVDVGGVRIASVQNLWIPFQSGSGHDDLFLAIITRSNNSFFVANDDIHIRVTGLKYT